MVDVVVLILIGGMVAGLLLLLSGYVAPRRVVQEVTRKEIPPEQRPMPVIPLPEGLSRMPAGTQDTPLDPPPTPRRTKGGYVSSDRPVTALRPPPAPTGPAWEAGRDGAADSRHAALLEEIDALTAMVKVGHEVGVFKFTRDQQYLALLKEAEAAKAELARQKDELRAGFAAIAAHKHVTAVPNRVLTGPGCGYCGTGGCIC